MVYQKYNQKLFNAILSVDFDFYPQSTQSVKEAKSLDLAAMEVEILSLRNQKFDEIASFLAMTD